MATPHPVPFGALLKRYRLAVGLTQAALAEQAGLSLRAISDLERGVNHTPHQDTCRLLADALQLAPAERASFEAAARWRGASGARLVSGGRPPRPTHTLIGRAREVARLQHHLAGEGPPLLLLAGEPGIGKTRLLVEAVQDAVQRGWRVLEGGCHRRSGQEPYAPLVGALEHYLQQQAPAQRRADVQGCAWLVRLLPELAETEVTPATSRSAPAEQERRLLFAAVRRFLANIAGPTGTLLVLDDLQWAGPDALDLLTSLLRSAATPPVRVIGAYRTTEVRPQEALAVFLADLAGAGLATQAELGPLAHQEAAELLDALLTGGAEEALRQREQVLRQADGVPFFLVSCAQVLQSGALAGSSAEVVPWTVAQSIRQRVAALPETAQDVLGVAAVAGRVVTGAVLVAASTWPKQEIVIALDAACQARLLVESGEESYQFPHDLIREVVEADLSRIRRQQSHRLVAVALEQGPAACPAEVLAYHYRQAGELEAALGYLIQAAERARQAGAHREVASLLAEAIDCAQRTGQGPLALELRAQRGKACRTMAMWTEASVELEAVLSGLPAEQIEQRVEALATLPEVLYWLGDTPGARRYATEALTLGEQIGRDELAARAINALALADSSDGDLQTSLEHFQQAFVRAGDEHISTLAFGVEHSGLVHYWMGSFDDAVERTRHALALAQQSSDTTTTARALANLGLALGGQGRYADALQVFAQARRFAQEQGTERWSARAIAMCGGLHLEVFDFVGAQALAEEARELGHSLRWPLAVVSGGIDLLLNFARRGEVGRTETLVDQVAAAAAAAQGVHGWLWRLRFAAAQGEIALARGEWETAVRAAAEAIAQSQQRGRVKYHALGLEIRAKALAALGRKQEGIVDLRLAVALARPTADPAMFLRAAVALLALDGDDALLAEAWAGADAIAAALPDEEMRRRFTAAEPLRLLMR